MSITVDPLAALTSNKVYSEPLKIKIGSVILVQVKQVNGKKEKHKFS